jgi:hypothetical protein
VNPCNCCHKLSLLGYGVPQYVAAYCLWEAIRHWVAQQSGNVVRLHSANVYRAVTAYCRDLGCRVEIDRRRAMRYLMEVVRRVADEWGDNPFDSLQMSVRLVLYIDPADVAALALR